MFEKCKYYNNHNTSCSLMIDDIVPVAVCPINDKVINTKNDWGYLMNDTNSLYSYFKENILLKFPKIKGTFFIPISSYKYIKSNDKFKVYNRGFDKKFVNFIKNISENFDFAFHGTSHGKYIDINSSKIKDNWKQEFEYLNLKDVKRLNKEITDFERTLNIKLSGGKYPGYKKNQFSEKIIEELNFKWWASSSIMINTKGNLNKTKYFGLNNSIVDIPTNLSGDIFNSKFSKKGFIKILKDELKKFFKKKDYHNPKDFILHLYNNKLPITIQEHFQNQRTDGIRQTPNIYDDINSLSLIFELLKDLDIWYSNCSELCHYIDSYNNTIINFKNDKEFEISYNGNWDKMFLSFISIYSQIENLENGYKTKGTKKGDKWIYNNIAQGAYKYI